MHFLEMDHKYGSKQFGDECKTNKQTTTTKKTKEMQLSLVRQKTSLGKEKFPPMAV